MSIVKWIAFIGLILRYLPAISHQTAKNTFIQTILFLCTCGWSRTLQSQTFLPYFQYIGSVNGQPTSAEGNIVQDELGFIWIPSSKGLLRFDGYELSPFLRSASDTAAILSDNLQSLQMGSKGRIFIATHFEGFSIFDTPTGTFENWQPNAADTVAFFTRKVNEVAEEADGSLWLCHRGFQHWQPYRGVMQNYYPSEILGLTGELAEAADIVLLLRIDPQQPQYLWIGTRLGLMRFDKKTERLEFFPFEKELNTSIANSPRDIHFGEDGKVYAGTWYNGLQVFDPKTKRYETHYFFGKRNPHGLSNSICRIVKKSNNELWMVSPVSGLFIYEIFSKKFRLVSPYYKLSNLPKSSPYCLESELTGLLQDRNGTYWLLMNNGGLEVMHPQQQQFKKLLTGTTVRKVVPEPGTHRLFLIASDGNLHIYDQEKDELKTSLAENRIYREELRMGAFSANGKFRLLGLNTFYGQLLNGRVVPKSLPPFDSLQLAPEMYDNSFAWCFLEDGQQNLWVPLKRKGILKVHLPSGAYRIYQISHMAFGKEYFWGFPGDILETEANQIWISFDEGVCFTSDAGKSWTKYPFTSPANRKVEFREINCLQTDRRGRLWMGSERNGLFYLYTGRPHPQTIHSISTPEGLPSLRVFDLELDAKGHLWLITDKGLSKMDVDKLTFENYGPEYGLDGLRKLTLLPSGEMAIAASGGFYLFHPDSVHLDTTVYLPIIHGFEVLGSEFKTNKAIHSLTIINLKHHQNFFTFKFSAPNFWAPGLVKYQYQLVGVDPKWVDAGQVRFANYTAVAPGHYTFKVRASNVRGEWNETFASLHLVIAPPWWASWWAYAIYLMALITVLYAFYHFQLRKKLAEAEARRLHDLDEFKTRFYTNITHEFRTPLTLILGPVEKALKNRLPLGMPDLELVKRSGRHLLRLVNQMLNLSKLDAKSLKVNLTQGDIVAFLRYMTESFHSVADDKGVEVVFIAELAKFVMDFDREKLTDIIGNLLSNALKFTPTGGRVQLNIELTNSEDLPTLQVRVSDTGPGISSEQLPHIFDRFYTSNTIGQEGMGMGIGLALAKELVERLDGSIWVESNPEREGAVFTVSLPVINHTGLRMSIEEQSIVNLKSEFENQSTDVIHKSEIPLILIIEDNPDVARFIGGCLIKQFQVEFAGNGREGVERALALVPDLVVSDVMMPEMDGFEVTRLLKNDERTSHIPVILLTARADMVSRLEGLGRGADSYLAKPFHEEELLVSVQKLLELRRKLQSWYQRQTSLEEAATPDEAEKTIENAFLQKVRSSIEARLDDPAYSVEDLSHTVGMSHSQLHRKMVALTGRSVQKFVRSVRLQKAKELLRSSELTVAEIAYKTGFSEPGYFTKVFAKEFGITPSEWKK